MPAVSTTTRPNRRERQEGDRRAERRARGDVLPPRREGAHERALAPQRVDPDPVAEEGAAGAAARRVDGDDRDLELREPLEQPRHDLVGDGALAGAARAGDPDDGGDGARRLPGGELLVERLARQHAVLDRGEHLGDGEVVVDAGLGERSRPPGGHGARDEVVDHPRQPELEPVVRVVDPLDAERLELGDLRGRDRAPAAAEDADVAGAALAQHLDHVAEVLDVPALVGADGDRVGVLLDRRAHDLGDAAVVAEVDHLRARAPGSACA